MKLSCKVIEDMLPMYYDDVCSEETAALVAQHLQECPHCSKIMDDLTNDFVIEAEKPDDIKPLKRLQKSYKKKKLIALIAILLVVAMVPVAFLFGNEHGKPHHQIEYSEEDAVADADRFMANIIDGDYTAAFSHFDIEEKKREWRRDFFSDDVLVNFEVDALNAFCKAGAEMESLGGFESYQLKSVSNSGYDNYGNKEYFVSYAVEFSGKAEGISISISPRGIRYFLAGDSSIAHPLTSFCYWGQSLYEKYLENS